MCQQQSLLGPPKHPYSQRKCPCIICVTKKTTHPPKAKMTSSTLTSRDQLLHIDFSFWTITSYRGFTSLLSIIDCKDRVLRNFSTASKRAPISVLTYFFSLLSQNGVTVKCVCVDEDALAKSSEFSDLLVQHNISMETIGGFAIEHPHHTIAQVVQALLLNFGLPFTLWCYVAKTAADIYQYTHHSALNKTPYEAWYGIKPHINNL
jgi:hypothetical protein